MIKSIQNKYILLIMLILTISIVFLGKYFYNEKILLNNLKYTDSNIEVSYQSTEKESDHEWLIQALNGEKFDNEIKKLTEDEFLAMLFKIYHQLPKNSSSNYWADGYYLKASDLGYSLEENNQKRTYLTYGHAAEIVASFQGEILQGDKAIQFLVQNNITPTDGVFSTFNEGDYLTRKDALQLVTRVGNLGFDIPQKILNNNFENIVAIGDSITLGYGINTDESWYKYGFPSIIEKSVSNFNVNNIGILGLKTYELVEKIKLPMFRDKIKSANVVLFNLGSADLLKASTDFLTNVKNGKNRLPNKEELELIESTATEVTKNTNKLLKAMRQLNPDAKILLYGMYNPIPEGSIASEFGESIITDLNNKLKNIARTDENIHYLDTHSTFKGHQSQYLISGDAHPNYYGQKLLAKLSISYLKN